MRGRVMDTRRSIISYMRSPRRVTRQPMDMPSRSLKPTRVGWPQAGHTSMTLDASIGASRSITPPCGFFFGCGLVCFFIMLSRSSTTRPFSMSTRSTLPVLPVSLPLTTLTWSSFLIFILLIVTATPSPTRPLQDLRGERHDLHEVLLAQLAGHGPEDAGPARVVLVVDQHGGVLVERDVRAVLATELLLGAHHHGTDDLALLDAAAGRGDLDGADDDVADRRVAPLGATADPDAEDLARARVVGDS